MTETPQQARPVRAAENGSGSRSPEQIERDIAATRTQLAGTIDEIADKVSPAKVKRRAVDRAKAEVDRIKARIGEQITDDNGNIDPKKVAPLAAAALGLVLFRALRKVRDRRSARALRRRRSLR